MSCPDCKEFQEGSSIFPYRWGRANIWVRGCRKHVTEVFKVLSAAQEQDYQQRTIKVNEVMTTVLSDREKGES